MGGGLVPLWTGNREVIPSHLGPNAPSSHFSLYTIVTAVNTSLTWDLTGRGEGGSKGLLGSCPGSWASDRKWQAFTSRCSPTAWLWGLQLPSPEYSHLKLATQSFPLQQWPLQSSTKISHHPRLNLPLTIVRSSMKVNEEDSQWCFIYYQHPIDILSKFFFKILICNISPFFHVPCWSECITSAMPFWALLKLYFFLIFIFFNF